jgi:hypothetical protein
MAPFAFSTPARSTATEHATQRRRIASATGLTKAARSAGSWGRGSYAVALPPRDLARLPAERERFKQERCRRAPRGV